MEIVTTAWKIICAALLLSACSACSDGSDAPVADTALPVSYDFSAVNAAFQQFLDESTVFDGISVTLVETEEGTVHEAAFGDHDLDIVVMLASTSKVPTVTLLMALSDDEALDYDVETPIGNYLPWDGLYGDRTTVDLVSNTSGIIGLAGLGNYGSAVCQFLPTPELESCAEILYTTEVIGTQPAGSIFSYGGTQWQLSGAVAQQVSNSSWAQLFDEYIGQPCELDVFQYGNPWSDLGSFDGSPDSLIGLSNPHMEGGAISNMRDYAKLLLLHLRGGRCGDTQVLRYSAKSLSHSCRSTAQLALGQTMAWAGG